MNETPVTPRMALPSVQNQYLIHIFNLFESDRPRSRSGGSLALIALFLRDRQASPSVYG